MASICCSPPDMVPASWPRRSPSRGNRPKARSSTSRWRTPAKVTMRRFSRTVRFGKMPRPSGMVHTPIRASASGATPFTWRPPMWTHPAVAASWPLATLSVVVLPPPLGPSSATTAPRGHDEVDAVQHLDAAVGGPHAGQLEHRHDRRRRLLGCVGRGHRQSSAAEPR